MTLVAVRCCCSAVYDEKAKPGARSEIPTSYLARDLILGCCTTLYSLPSVI